MSCLLSLQLMIMSIHKASRLLSMLSHFMLIADYHDPESNDIPLARTWQKWGYRQTFNTRRTHSKNVDVSRHVLQLPLPNHRSQFLSFEWRCSSSSAVRRCSNYIWEINNSIAKAATDIRGLVVLLNIDIHICNEMINSIHDTLSVMNLWDVADNI